MYAYLRLETLRLLRDGGFIIMSLVMPVTIYLLFSALLLSDHPTNDELVTSMVGMAGFGALGSVVNSCVGVAEDKDIGWLRQLRLTPLSPVAVVVGRGLCAMGLVLLPLTAVGLLGWLVKGVHLDAAHWAGTFLLMWIGIIPMILIGLGAGYLLSVQKAHTYGLLGYMVLSAIGGMWVTIDRLPGWVQPASKITPTFRFGQLSRDASAGHTPAIATVAILAGWAVIGAAFALYSYRRSGRTG